MANEREVVVTVAPTHSAKLASVVKALKAAGLLSPQPLGEIGIVTGKLSATATLESLKAVAGVADAEFGETSYATTDDAG